MNGLLLVDKPTGLSSHAVVARVRRALGTRKVGHAGTLDPAASGLLVLGVGAGTRLLTFLVGLDKTYAATIRLGIGTDSDDADGTETAAPGCTATMADLAPLVAGLTGPIRQRPSAVSAVHIDGRRAYDRVRAGESVELPEREVTVHDFQVVSVDPATVPGPDGPVPVVDLDVVVSVSSGTYIRALARDLGLAAGAAGHLTALRRTSVGPFPIAEAVQLDGVGAGTPLLPLGVVAAAVLPPITIDPEDVHSVRHGARLACGAGPGPHALLDPDGALLAVSSCAEGRWRHLMVVPSATLERT